MRKFIVNILLFSASWYFTKDLYYWDRRDVLTISRFGIIFMWNAFFLSIIVAIVLGIYYDKMSLNTYWIILGSFEMIAILLAIFFGGDCVTQTLRTRTKCPKCLKHMAIERGDNKLVSESAVTKKLYSGKNTEFKTYLIGVRRVDYTCRFCNHNFSHEYRTKRQA